jgi:transcriptional regulator of acetoin/glycerol metabolism
VLGSPEAGATAGDPPAAPSDLLLRSERARIEAALGATRYSLGKAASLLGMHRTTLYRKRLRFGI